MIFIYKNPFFQKERIFWEKTSFFEEMFLPYDRELKNIIIFCVKHKRDDIILKFKEYFKLYRYSFFYVFFYKLIKKLEQISKSIFSFLS